MCAFPAVEKHLANTLSHTHHYGCDGVSDARVDKGIRRKERLERRGHAHHGHQHEVDAAHASSPCHSMMIVCLSESAAEHQPDLMMMVVIAESTPTQTPGRCVFLEPKVG